MYNSPYKSVVECARNVFQQEGFGAFYRSYTTQLVMNLPFHAIHFSTYEFFQEMVRDLDNNSLQKFFHNFFLLIAE